MGVAPEEDRITPAEDRVAPIEGRVAVVEDAAAVLARRISIDAMQEGQQRQTPPEAVVAENVRESSVRAPTLLQWIWFYGSMSEMNYERMMYELRRYLSSWA